MNRIYTLASFLLISSTLGAMESASNIEPISQSNASEQDKNELLESLGKDGRITIIDHNGSKNTIDSYNIIEQLKKCETIKNIRGTGDYDFTDVQESVTIDNILRLAEYIKNPKIIAAQTIEINKQMLKLADYLDAPENILFELANILWEHAQEESTDTEAAKVEKQILRGIAEPYLHCPAFLLTMLKANFRQTPPHNENMDLSFNDLVTARLIQSPWLKAENNLLYNYHHHFCSLKGLKDLLIFLGSQGNRTRINLSGHHISNFALSEIQGNFSSIDLSHNWITTLEAEQFDTSIPKNRNYEMSGINLSHNKISSVNKNIYDLAKKWRLMPGGSATNITISDNALTEMQKNDIRAQWDKAIDTLPERIHKRFDRPGSINPIILTYGLGTCGLGSFSAGYTVNHMLTNSSTWVRYPALAISSLTGFLYGGIAAIITERNSNPSNGLYSALMGAEAGACLGSYYITNALKNVPSSTRIPITLATLPTTAALGAAAFWLASKLPKGSSYFSSLAAKITHPQIKFGDYNAVWNAEKPSIYL